MLTGPASSGKTTTLNKVYDTLTASCGAVAGPKVSVQNTAKNAAKNDIDVVLWYKHKYIAVYSHGDVQQDCVEAIVKHSDKDILILAYRDAFAHLPGNIDKYPHTHTILEKTVAAPPLTEAAANTQDCNSIIALI
jgi:hypothetical protein